MTSGELYDMLTQLGKMDRLDNLAELFERIISKLDELDQDDVFGSEGWKRYFGIED